MSESINDSAKSTVPHWEYISFGDGASKVIRSDQPVFEKYRQRLDALINDILNDPPRAQLSIHIEIGRKD